MHTFRVVNYHPLALRIQYGLSTAIYRYRQRGLIEERTKKEQQVEEPDNDMRDAHGLAS